MTLLLLLNPKGDGHCPDLTAVTPDTLSLTDQDAVTLTLEDEDPC